MSSLSNPLPDAVQWSEGMLLSPQHFQQSDAYWQQQLRYRIAMLNPYSFGLAHLRYELNQEVLFINELECLLPDGLLLQYPGKMSNAQDGASVGQPELDLGPACKVHGGALRVWLFVNARGALASVQESRERRYNSYVDIACADENTGDGWLELARLQVQFQLVVSSKSPSPENAMPLLEVMRRDNGQLVVTPYHPPLLSLAASQFHGEAGLLRRWQRLYDALWQKLQQLNHALEQGKDGANAPGEQARHARLLAAMLPPLALLQDGQCHPREAYQLLAQLVGQCAALGASPMPLLMKPYAHEHCLPQFAAAFEFIEQRLAQIDGTHEHLVFEQKEAGDSAAAYTCFERELADDCGEVLLIELKPREAQTKAQLLAWLNEAIIAERSLIPLLLRARMSGVTPRAMTEREIKLHQLNPEAALFVLENQPMPIDEAQGKKLFAAGQTLQIRGRKQRDLPAAIHLVQGLQKAKGSRHD